MRAPLINAVLSFAALRPPGHRLAVAPSMRAQSSDWRLFGVEVPVLATVDVGRDYNSVLNVSEKKKKKQ